MTSNPNIPPDQIPRVDRLPENEAEKEFFADVEDVPELSLEEQEQVIDAGLDELKHGEAYKAWFEKGGRIDERNKMKQGIRRVVDAREKQLQKDGANHEKIAKDIAARRKAENAEELAEDLKEINARKYESVKKAGADLLLRLESTKTSLPNDEVIDKKAAKAEVKAKEREERLADKYDLDDAKLEKKVAENKKPETILSRKLRELEKAQESGENLSKKDALEIRENDLLEKLAVEKNSRERVKLAGKLLLVRDSLKELKESGQVKEEKPKETIVTDLTLVETLQARKADLRKRIEAADESDRKELINQALVIDADLVVLEANQTKGQRLKQEHADAQTKLVEAEGHVDAETLASADRELATARETLDKALQAAQAPQSKIEAVKNSIRKIEQILAGLPTRERRKQLPLKQPELQALHARRLELEERLEPLATRATEAREAVREKEQTRANLLPEVNAAQERVATTQAALDVWNTQQEHEVVKARASEAARNERETQQQEQERAEAKQKSDAETMTATFGQEKSMALARLSVQKLKHQAETFEVAVQNEPNNPILAEMAKRYREEFDRRGAKSKAGKEVEALPSDEEILARLKRMSTAVLERRYAKLTTPHQTQTPMEQQELDVIEGILIDRGDKSTKWETKFQQARRKKEVEDIQVEAKKEDVHKLNELSIERLEKILTQLHQAIADATVPSDNDVRRSEMIENILLERGSTGSDVPDEEASRIMTLSKPLTPNERDALAQELQVLSFEDLVARARNDFEFFEADPMNHGFADRAEVYKAELARRADAEPTQDLPEDLLAYADHLESEREEPPVADTLVEKIDQEREEHPEASGHETTRVYRAGGENDLQTTSARNQADKLFPGLANTPDTHIKEKSEEAPTPSRQEVLKAAEQLFNLNTPLEKTVPDLREQAAAVPLSELAKMLQTAIQESGERRKTAADPEGLRLINDLQDIFKNRIATPENIRAELEKETDSGMRAQLEKRLPPAPDEAAVA